MSALPAWPDYALPAPPLGESYRITLPNNVLRTDMEQGAAEQETIFRSGATQYAPTWPMTPAQFEIFKGVRRHLLADGAGWFTLPVFDGTDYVTRTVRFVAGPLQPQWQSGEWMTSATLETMDDISATEIDTAVMLLLYGSDVGLGDMIMLLEGAVFDLAEFVQP